MSTVEFEKNGNSFLPEHVVSLMYNIWVGSSDVETLSRKYLKMKDPKVENKYWLFY